MVLPGATPSDRGSPGAPRRSAKAANPGRRWRRCLGERDGIEPGARRRPHLALALVLLLLRGLARGRADDQPLRSSTAAAVVSAATRTRATSID